MGKRDQIPMPPGVIKLSDDELKRKNGIFYILIKQFQSFCESPNRRQIMRIDTISPKLKPYFLDEDDKKEESGDDGQWIVSFDKLSFSFPNLKQIHFLNFYRFDNEILR